MQSITNVRSALELNIAKLKDFKGSKKEEKSVVEEMNNTYGETMGYFSSVSEWYEALIKNSEKYCRQMVAEAKARSLANQIANIEEENRVIGQNIVNDKYSKENEKRKQIISTGTSIYGGVQTYESEIEGTSELDKARDAMQENYNRINDLKKEMEKAIQEAGSIVFDVTGSLNPNKNDTNSVNKELQLIANPNTLKDLQNNVSFYSQEILKADMSNEALVKSLFRMKEEAEKAVSAFNLLKYEKPDDLSREISSVLSDTEHFKKLLESLNGMEIDLNINTDPIDKIKESMELSDNISKIAGAVDQLGQSMAGLAGESKAMQTAMAGVSVAAAIAQLIAVMVKKLSESFTIWGFIAGTIAGTAAVVSAITQLKSVAAFAQGGIVSGPTMALVGEYAGAQNNPEVIAPLDKLRSMMQPAGFDGGLVHFKIEGRDLVGVIKKENDHSRRS